MLTKMAHFIPCTSTVNSVQLAKLFMSNVYRLHGLPRYLIGDRDSRYTSEFFRSLMTELRTKLCLSTAYHPQSDGNTERCHRTIEAILRAFVHDDHEAWHENLVLAEFAYNNNVHTSTGFSPFMANYGYDPSTPLNLIDPPVDTSTGPGSDAKNTRNLNKLLNVHQLIVEQLKIAKAVQKHYADKSRTPMEFKVGDYVLLSTQNLKLLNQPSKKFKNRYIGPYRIKTKVSPQAYELDLDAELHRVHPVFHISLLREYHSTDPAADIPDKIPIANDMKYGDDHFYVEKLLDHKIAPFKERYKKGPALLFKVRWEGYGPDDDTWEPYVNVKRTGEFDDYLRDNEKFRLLLTSDEYKKLSNSYSHRFPKVLRDKALTPVGGGGM